MELRSGFGCAVWFVLGCMACSDKDYAADRRMPCYQDSDCSDDLVCALGACRNECKESRDCGNGGSCVSDDVRAVCQPLAEKDTPCYFQRDCPPPLACASDYRCRNLCNDDDDCNVLGISGRSCAQDANKRNYCAERSETKNGKLVVAPPKGTKTIGSGPRPPMSGASGADGGAGMKSPMAGSDAGAGTGGESGAGGTGGTGGPDADAGGSAGASGTAGGTSGDGGIPPQAGTGGASGTGGSSGSSAGPAPWHLWVSAVDGHIYGYAPMQLLATNGDAPDIDFAAPVTADQSMIFDGTGRLWTTGGLSFVRYAAAAFSTAALEPGTRMSLTMELRVPVTGNQLALDGAGNAWLATQSSVERYDAADLEGIVGTATVAPKLTVTRGASGVVADSNNHIYAADGASLSRYDVDQLQGTGGISEAPAFRTTLGAPNGTLLQSPTKQLLVIGGTILRFSAAQVAQSGTADITPEATFTVSGASGLHWGAFDPEGNLWVSGSTDHIFRVSAEDLAQTGAVTVTPAVTIRAPVSNLNVRFNALAVH